MNHTTDRATFRTARDRAAVASGGGPLLVVLHAPLEAAPERRGRCGMSITPTLERVPRAVLIIINLFIPAEDDVLSLDAVIDGRVRRVFGSPDFRKPTAR